MSRRRDTTARKAEVIPDSPPVWLRRGTFLLAAIALFVFVFFAYAGAMWAAALYRLLIEAPILLLWLAAMLGAGGKLYRLFGSSADDAAAIPASIALGIGLYSLLMLVLGWVGVLSRPLAIVLLFAGFALSAINWLRPNRQSPTANRKSPSLASYLNEAIPGTNWLWLLAIPFLAIATLAAFMPPGVLWGGEPNGYDVVEYHLQVPREWYEAGRVLPLRHNVFSYFPFNVEMHYLLAMYVRGGPWAGMYLAQLMHLAMIVLGVVAMARFSNDRGRLGALLAACTPWLTLLAPIAYNEGGLLLFGTLAIGYTWRAIAPQPSPPSRIPVPPPREAQPAVEPAPRARSLWLAGAFTGFACGVKLTAVPMLLIPLPLLFIATTLLRRDRGIVRSATAFALCALLVFSPWLIRNFRWTRNPVFPEAMSVFGRAHFTAAQAERWRLAYVPPPDQRSLPSRLNACWDQIIADWRYGYVLIPAAVIVMLRGKRWGGGIVFLGGLLLIWLAFWLLFTHLQSRFYVLAIPVLAMVISQVEAPVARLAVVCGVLLQAGFGFLNLQRPISERFAVVALGLDSMTPLLAPEDVAKAVNGATGEICLVGDAKAFLYEVPMARLRYRTVFDVDVRDRDVVDAWADGCRRAEGDVIVINYDELRRFAKTYHGIPSPSGDAKGIVVVHVQR